MSDCMQTYQTRSEPLIKEASQKEGKAPPRMVDEARCLSSLQLLASSHVLSRKVMKQPVVELAAQRCFPLMAEQARTGNLRMYKAYEIPLKRRKGQICSARWGAVMEGSMKHTGRSL